MTFDEVLEHVIDLLKRQGCVSYRALKRQARLSIMRDEGWSGQVFCLQARNIWNIEQLQFDHGREYT